MSYRIFDGYMNPQQLDGYVHVQNSGVYIYTFDGYNIGFFTGADTVYDSAKGVIYLLNRINAPTSNPSGGLFFYAEDGDGYIRNSNGWVQSVTGTRVVRQLTLDANYTAVQSDYQSKIIEVTSSLSLTATRNFVLPIVSGYQWTVYNNTTGAQSIQFIGSTGTGITIANGKRAIVYCDGTNIVRVSPDT